MTAQFNIDDYMMDAKGNLVPKTMVKPEHKLEDDLVRDLVGQAAALHIAMTEFKNAAMADIQGFRDLIAEKYGSKIGGKKGNMTLNSFDGEMRVQVATSERLVLGPELKAAKDLIDECVIEWSAGSNDAIKALVNDAFNVGKEGSIDTKRVLALRRIDIKEEKWLRAMDAINDAIRVASSKVYLRIYCRNEVTGEYDPLALDLAAL